ncbi:unnamed protein product [Anisakis simplex]|uniref:SRI domain-containing protein n=1 Tax=Anisakis simplex TaxID=6269 RepID=A0A0M3JX85_ANISI|nr:unnamed protein product [Anisakis simplex]
MDVQHVAENNVRRNNTRKNRSTRWDNPSTSAKLMQNANRPDDLNNTYNNINYNTANTTTTAMNNNISKITAASIPLPSGPPLPPISLDNIPIPNRSSALSASISSINTTPSTSFALNLAPPFGLAPPLGLSSVANAHLGQLQLPSQMFPNILMQPSFPVGAMNNILAAGILGNASLGSSISQANNPFVLGQMPNQNAHLTQQIANLTSFQSNVSSAQQQRLPLAGVPPPPPLANRLPETDAASLEPLAERIRQLTEGNVIHPFGENTVCGSGMVVKQCKEDVKGTNEWGGRKSASAEEEEQTIDKDAKVHKNGPMFDQARQLLSESLKKAYKKKRITKDEYKEIMKKGVAALSQRTKLDEKKVAEYANKYVEYMLAKRAKK